MGNVAMMQTASLRKKLIGPCLGEEVCGPSFTWRVLRQLGLKP